MFKFSKREISVLTMGSLFLIIFVGVQFVYSPLIEKRDNLERIVVQKLALLEEMFLLQHQFMSISGDFDARTEIIKKRGRGFSLFTFLDSQAQQSGVKENVAYMKPSVQKIENSVYTRAIVQVSLKAVGLKALVDFLYRIESANNDVTITSLSVNKTGKEKIKLDAVIETQTLMPMEKS